MGGTGPPPPTGLVRSAAAGVNGSLEGNTTPAGGDGVTERSPAGEEPGVGAAAVYDALCAGSCAESCDASRPTDSGCWCDEACPTMGDCCLDYEAMCGNGNGSGSRSGNVNGDGNGNGSRNGNESENASENCHINGSGNETWSGNGSGNWSASGSGNRSVVDGSGDGNCSVSGSGGVSKGTATAHYVALLAARQFRLTRPQCVTIVDKAGRDMRLLMAASCDAIATLDTTRWLCENTTDNDTAPLSTPLDALIPVMRRGVIYRNKYCAQCTDRPSDEADVVFPATFYCSDSQNEAARAIWWHEGKAAFVAFARERCELRFDTDPLATAYEISRYACDNDGTVASCDPRLTDTLADYPYFAGACHEYTSIVYSADRKTGVVVRYKNAHCAVCSGVTDVRALTCDAPPAIGTWGEVPTTERGDQVNSFSALLDFGDRALWESADPALCPPASALDVAGRCVRRRCPAGSAFVVSGCVALNVTLPQLLDDATRWTATLVLAYHNVSRGLHPATVGVLPEYVAQEVRRTRLPRWDPARYASFQMTCTDLLLLGVTDHARGARDHCVVMTTDNATVTDAAVITTLASTSPDFLARFNRLAGVTPNRVLVLNHGGWGEGCREGAVVTRHDVSLVTGDTAVYTTAVVNATAATYPLASVPVQLAWAAPAWRRTATAHVCELRVMSCETVSVRAGEYQQDAGGRLVVAGRVIAHTDSLPLPDGTTAVCVDAMPPVALVLPSTSQPAAATAQQVLSAVGNAVSMLFLLVTLTTYALLAPLRNVPGICVMNLCSALLLAQLTFLLAGLRDIRADELRCAVIAAAQHFLWLAAFLWMNVLAYDIARVLTLPVASDNASRARACAYAAYAWGAPAAFVSICVVLHSAPHTAFRYGSSVLCWLSGERAVLYYFAVPLATIIATNAVLFAHTLVKVRRTIRAAKHAAPRNRNELRIYVRLTSVMGFTWLLGFLANVRVLAFLWYAFILCNTLQGLFIFISFVCKKRIAHLYKERFGQRVATVTTTNRTRSSTLDKR